MNKFAVVNRWTNEVVAEATHYQAAAKAENELTEKWKQSFMGPFLRTVTIPFSVCRIDMLSRFYPRIRKVI